MAKARRQEGKAKAVCPQIALRGRAASETGFTTKARTLRLAQGRALRLAQGRETKSKEEEVVHRLHRFSQIKGGCKCQARSARAGTNLRDSGADEMRVGPRPW